MGRVGRGGIRPDLHRRLISKDDDTGGNVIGERGGQGGGSGGNIKWGMVLHHRGGDGCGGGECFRHRTNLHFDSV